MHCSLQEGAPHDDLNGICVSRGKWSLVARDPSELTVSVPRAAIVPPMFRRITNLLFTQDRPVLDELDGRLAQQTRTRVALGSSSALQSQLLAIQVTLRMSWLKVDDRYAWAVLAARRETETIGGRNIRQVSPGYVGFCSKLATTWPGPMTGRVRGAQSPKWVYIPSIRRYL